MLPRKVSERSTKAAEEVPNSARHGLFGSVWERVVVDHAGDVFASAAPQEADAKADAKAARSGVAMPCDGNNS